MKSSPNLNKQKYHYVAKRIGKKKKKIFNGNIIYDKINNSNQKEMTSLISAVKTVNKQVGKKIPTSHPVKNFSN